MQAAKTDQRAKQGLFLLGLALGCLPAAAAEAVPDAHEKAPSGGMTHRFTDAESWARRWDDPKRDAWQRPEAVLRALDLRPDMHVADIGAGTGYFAVRFARLLKEGKVWAIDIERSMVRYLRRRSAREGLSNIVAVRTRPDQPGLAGQVDLVFICNTYHHIPGRASYLRKLAPMLRDGGRLAVVDFKLGKIPVGPAERHRVSPSRLESELSAAGFVRLKLDSETLPYQYIAIYRLSSQARRGP